MTDNNGREHAPKGQPTGGQFVAQNTYNSQDRIKALSSKIFGKGKFVKTGETVLTQPEDKDVVYRGSDKYPQAIKRYRFDAYDTSIEHLYGKEYKGYKGREALEKLLQEKQGHVKNAFFYKGIGNIDLIWGNDNCGLKHIIKRRIEQHIKISTFLDDLLEVLDKGVLVDMDKSKHGNYEILYKGKLVVVSRQYFNNKVNFVFTAFKTRKKTPN